MKENRSSSLFLELISHDMKSNPGRILPIPQDIFARMDALIRQSRKSLR